MVGFMDRNKSNERLGNSDRLFPSEDIAPIHAAAYFGDDDAMKFISSLRQEDLTRKTSAGRTPLEIAEHFNTRGSHDRFITKLMQMTQ